MNNNEKYSCKTMNNLKLENEMIEYAKVILPKVCFWKNLFKKELLKCVSWTKSIEMEELVCWCYENFYEMHPDVLDEVFSGNVNWSNENLKSFYSCVNKSQEKHVKQRKILELA